MSRLNQLEAKMRTVHARGVQQRTTYKGRLRFLQTRLRDGADPLDIQHVEQFGLTAAAPAGSENIVLSFGGNRSHSVVIFAWNEKYKLTVEDGETCLYNQWGDYFKLNKGREAYVKAASKVILDAPETIVKQNFKVEGNSEFMGAVNIQGAVTALSTVLFSGITTFAGAAIFNSTATQGGKSIGADHQHSGVQAGSNNSGGIA